jgi:hypothetical protein
MIATSQWALHGLVMQVFLFYCVLPSSETTLNYKSQQMTSKSDDYFKWLLESQNKHSKTFVNEVTVSETA